MTRSTITLLACALALAACKPTSPATPATVTAAQKAAKPALPNDNLNAVLWVQTSAEYGAVCETLYRAATAQLDAALADRDRDALVPEHHPARRGHVVVLNGCRHLGVAEQRRCGVRAGHRNLP